MRLRAFQVGTLCETECGCRHRIAGPSVRLGKTKTFVQPCVHHLKFFPDGVAYLWDDVEVKEVPAFLELLEESFG